MTRKLALEIGSSLNPVREALGRLAAEGVVDHVPGAGAFVHTPDWQELDDLYDFREAVEPHAAARAARFITDLELQELHAICEEERLLAREIRAAESGFATESVRERWIDAEERFHELIFKASRNRFMHRAVGESSLLSSLFLRHRRLDQLLSLRVAAQTWHKHRRLVAALSRGEREIAADLMRTQIREGRKHVVKLLQQERDRGHPSPPVGEREQ